MEACVRGLNSITVITKTNLLDKLDGYRQRLLSGDVHALARCISLVENEVEDYRALLQSLPASSTPVVGITGPPGAGKSSLTDGLIGHWVAQGKRVAVLCVDPSSPFNSGALLGDRIRMSAWYTHPDVFIRSLGSRGVLGGLNPNMIEVTDVVKAGGFDYVVIETVGVGQSELEIVGLADVTVLVLVPEAGDDVQVMKAGLMEIADVYVVNKADRPNVDQFVHHLRQFLLPGKHAGKVDFPVIKSIATTRQGIPELAAAIGSQLAAPVPGKYKSWLLAEKAWRLISAQRMEGITTRALQQQIDTALTEGAFNLYRFAHDYGVPAASPDANFSS